MPYSITRQDAAKDALAVRLILGALPAMVNTGAIERLTELADSIEEQVRPPEPTEWGSLIVAGTIDFPERVRWQRDADGFWQAEKPGFAGRWGVLKDPEVLRIGVGEAAAPVDADEFMVSAGFTPQPSKPIPPEPKGDVVVLDAMANAWIFDDESGMWLNDSLVASSRTWQRLVEEFPDDLPRVYRYEGELGNPAEWTRLDAANADNDAYQQGIKDERARTARFCTITANCRMADGHTGGCRP